MTCPVSFFLFSLLGSFEFQTVNQQQMRPTENQRSPRSRNVNICAILTAQEPRPPNTHVNQCAMKTYLKRQHIFLTPLCRKYL